MPETKKRRFKVVLRGSTGAVLESYDGATDLQLNASTGLTFMSNDGRQIITTAMYICKEEASAQKVVGQGAIPDKIQASSQGNGRPAPPRVSPLQ